jgi:hypothetical protein
VGDIIKARERGDIGMVTSISDKSLDVYFKNRETGLETTVTFSIKEGLIEGLEKVKPHGKNFVILDDGTILEKQRLYAPKDMAKNMNNILGRSKLEGIPGIHTITKYNAIIKAWILQSSFYHHLAFIRNYFLGTNNKLWSETSIRQAYKEGVQAIEELIPEIERAIRNGLTLFLRQDWEESLLQEKTIFGKVLDQVDVTREIKDKLLELRELQANFLFNEFGAGLKAISYLIEFRNQMKKYPGENPDVISKRVAEMVNANYGGLHLGRMGRNPTLQHIFRLFALAPDWTESNIQLTAKALKGLATGSPAELAVYQRLVAHWMMKGIATTALANFALAGGDIDEMMKNYEIAWEAGNLKWMQVDITPIYQAFGGETSRHKYFPLIGHMLDPLKAISNPVKFVHRKGSVVYKTTFEAIVGTNWAGKRYSTLGEFWEDGKLVKWGSPHALTYEQFPSYAMTQIIGTEPVQVQNLIGWVSGEMESFDAVTNSMGLGVTSTWEK